MTIYFAAARHQGCAAIAKALSPKVRLTRANDNSVDISGNPVMRAALNHFAEHGLGAANKACERAKAAASCGEQTECKYWLAVCRMFDRRMANQWASELGVALRA